MKMQCKLTLLHPNHCNTNSNKKEILENSKSTVPILFFIDHSHTKPYLFLEKYMSTSKEKNKKQNSIFHHYFTSTALYY